ncbi:MAG: hypothetical protein GY757_23920, partial [bacterium]|nr:hypothetical protein [bacterium]
EAGKITPDTISYLEAHGTGTLLGDPIEIKAAAEVYQAYTKEKQYCAVGSVKSNMGHAMTAAGVISLIKVISSLRYKQIPATLNCENPHPRFNFEESPFYPNTSLAPWKPRHGVRRAGISSFGFGGTNCHLIVEEGFEENNYSYPHRQPLPPTSFKRKWYWLGQEIQDEENIETEALEKEFFYNEALLKDHLIFNEPIIMGVAHLSLQLDYVRNVIHNRNTNIELKRILFSRAVMLRKNETGIVSVTGEKKTDKIIVENRFTVSGSGNGGDAASAQYVQSNPDLNLTIDIEKLKKESTASRSGDIFYKHKRQETYGPGLFNVRTVWNIAGGILAEIILTDTMKEE